MIGRSGTFVTGCHARGLAIKRLAARVLGFGALLLCPGVFAGGSEDPPPKPLPAGSTPAAKNATGDLELREDPIFVDRTRELGVEFEHQIFAGGEKYMPENMGPGLAVFDVDGDTRLDLLFVQGAPVNPADRKNNAQPLLRLFRQRQDGTFKDLGADAIVGEAGREVTKGGVGMGICLGDVEGDGDLDVYVTRFGHDVFFTNLGDGRFRETSRAAGFGKETWSTGCAFFDADGDGDLDLYVSSYVDFSLENHKYCGNAKKQLRAYCHPDVYNAVADVLYRNEGGKFEEVSRKAGILPTSDGKGLGVVAADFDGDGDQDLFVANDSTMNYLYLGDGRGFFEESALFAGLGMNGAGAAEASMGIVVSDLDGDLRPDMLLTHLDLETNTFYRNAGEGLFLDRSEASGLGAPSLPWVGFGVAALDVELDGDLDIAVVNGHIIDNIELFDKRRSHRQPGQFFLGEKGRFTEIVGALGLDPLVGRGLVAADLDRDGDEDLVLTQNGRPAKVLINNAGDGGASVTLRFQAKTSPPHGFGAHIIAQIGERKIWRAVPTAGSYLSQGPPEIVIGLGGAKKIDQLEVFWPSGRREILKGVAAGALEILEGATESAEP